jgi:hypothetical protein
MRLLRVAAMLLACTGAAAAGREFDRVVKAIETHFGATRTHIPMMGLADFVLKVGHPAGASGFHIALFQDLQTDLDEDRQVELDRFMDTLSSSTLRPLIRTRSLPDAEATYIFCGDTGKTTQILLATFNRREATVIEVKVQFETLLRWIQHPDEAGKALNPDRDGEGN